MKLLKILLLLLLNLSVYFIYNYTKNSNYKILSLGESISIEENKTYLDYYKEYKLQEINKVDLINYRLKDQTISSLIKDIKVNNKLKEYMSSTNILFINIGYNDLLYKLSREDNQDIYKLPVILNEINNDYNLLIKEISKYYKHKIIVIGYNKKNTNNYYLNKSIIYLNKMLKENKNVIYIDTYNLKSNKEVSKKIVKTLENK